jgi:transposase-like protein
MMECPFCSHPKSHRHGKTSKGSQRYFCPVCKQSFSETFDTLYYRRQITSEEIRLVLQAHSEGSSLRGISRITGLAYETIVSVINAASQKAQLIHNQALKDVDAESIGADEFWSFVEKSRNIATTRS